jgi:hypothetical protein
MHFNWKRIAKRSAFTFAALMSMASAAVAGTVTISTPGSGQTVSSNFHLVASASSSSAIKAMMVYRDGSKIKSFSGTSKVDTYISASGGQHRIVVQAQDSSGFFSKAIYVTVGTTSSGSGGGTTATTGSLFSNIDQMSGWTSCSVCAGAGGSGETASHSMYQNISSPSKDGRSAQFNLNANTAYAAALWWKQLGAKDGAHHFVYDVYFYLKNPSASQALEFDVNQSLNGKRYVFGTECSMSGSKTWRVWSAATRWQSTGVPCNRPSAYAWHHVTWEFQRTSTNQVKFVSVTLDGKKSYVNRTYSPQSRSAHELNVAFQMDANKNHTHYSTWVDKVSLRYW